MGLGGEHTHSSLLLLTLLRYAGLPPRLILSTTYILFLLLFSHTHISYHQNHLRYFLRVKSQPHLILLPCFFFPLLFFFFLIIFPPSCLKGREGNKSEHTHTKKKRRRSICLFACLFASSSVYVCDCSFTSHPNQPKTVFNTPQSPQLFEKKKERTADEQVAKCVWHRDVSQNPTEHRTRHLYYWVWLHLRWRGWKWWRGQHPQCATVLLAIRAVLEQYNGSGRRAWTKRTGEHLQ